MHRGYVKVFRCVKDNPLWFAEPFTRGQAWIDLILIANHKEGVIRRKGIKITVRRGEVGMSLRELSSRWRWSLGKIQRFFAELKLESQVHHRTDTDNNSVTTVICITNYESYQQTDTVADTATDTATIQERVQNNNNKNNKKLKHYTDEFEIFWKAYPKKTAKGSAFVEWQKANPPLHEVLNALEWQRESRKWKEGYILDPERYIKKRCWQDEPMEDISDAYQLPTALMGVR